MAAFNTDDFFWGTGWEGHRAELATGTRKNTSIHGIAQWQRFKDSPDPAPEWVTLPLDGVVAGDGRLAALSKGPGGPPSDREGSLPTVPAHFGAGTGSRPASASASSIS